MSAVQSFRSFLKHLLVAGVMTATVGAASAQTPTVSFSQVNRTFSGAGSNSVVGDFDGDGKPDIAFAAQSYIQIVLSSYGYSQPRFGDGTLIGPIGTSWGNVNAITPSLVSHRPQRCAPDSSRAATVSPQSTWATPTICPPRLRESIMAWARHQPLLLR